MKTIIFDWGGVILRESRQKRNIGKYYCDTDAIIDTLKHFNNKLTSKEAYNAYITTLRNEENEIISSLNSEKDKINWFNRINEKGKLDANYKEFVELFKKNYSNIDVYFDVINYIKSLKSRAKLCLFSDLIFFCDESLEKSIDLKIFDDIFLSYEEGYSKYEIDAFINVTNKLNIDPKNILFIDNLENNTMLAESIGWNVCLADGYQLDIIKKSVEEFLNN